MPDALPIYNAPERLEANLPYVRNDPKAGLRRVLRIEGGPATSAEEDTPRMTTRTPDIATWIMTGTNPTKPLSRACGIR